MERLVLNKLCTSRKTINVKTAHFPLELYGVVRRHLKIMKELYQSDFHEITWDNKCV